MFEMQTATDTYNTVSTDIFNITQYLPGLKKSPRKIL